MATRTRPLTVDYTPPRFIGVVFMIMGIGWCGFSLMAFTGGGGFMSYALGGCLLALGLAIFLMFGLRVFLFSRVVTFEPSGVNVKERGMFGAKDWRAPYSEFEGVSLRNFTRSGKNSSPIPLQIIELIHPEKLQITLKVIQTDDEPRAELEAFARDLNVPVVSDGEVRSVSDLDSALSERIDPDTFAGADWTNPPSGLQIDSTEDLISITLPPVFARPVLIAVLLFMVVPLLAFGSFMSSIILPIFFGVTTVAPVLAFAWFDRMKLRKLEISRDRVSFVPGSFNTATMQARDLPLGAIEEVTVGNGRGLRIATDDAILVTGPGLSAASQAWLKRYVQAAIISA